MAELSERFHFFTRLIVFPTMHKYCLMAHVNSILSFYIHTMCTARKKAMEESAAYFQNAASKVYKGLENWTPPKKVSTVLTEVMSRQSILKRGAEIFSSMTYTHITEPKITSRQLSISMPTTERTAQMIT